MPASSLHGTAGKTEQGRKEGHQFKPISGRTSCWTVKSGRALAAGALKVRKPCAAGTRGYPTYLAGVKVKVNSLNRFDHLRTRNDFYRSSDLSAGSTAELAKRRGGVVWSDALVLGEHRHRGVAGRAYKPACPRLLHSGTGVKLLLATYFEGMAPDLDTNYCCLLRGLHVNLGRDDQTRRCWATAPASADWLLSCGSRSMIVTRRRAILP